MKNTRVLITIVVFIMIFSLALTACVAAPNADKLSASGTISAVSVNIASELGGKIKEIHFNEGDQVQTGQALFTLDDEILKGQQKQTEAALARAKAGQEAAKAQLTAAETQYTLAVYGAQTSMRQETSLTWKQTLEDKIEQPAWYFTKSEEMEAARVDMDNSKKALDDELANLKKILADSGSSDFISLEKHLAEVQVAYNMASLTLKQTEEATNNTELKQAAQDNLDKAEADLLAAQKDYNQSLSSTNATDILEIRARVAVAKSRYENSVDAYNALLTRDDSLQIQAAADGVAQAKTALASAEAAINEAQAGLDLINLQISKSTIKAPIDGVVLSKAYEAGEIVTPGSTVLVAGQLDTVDLTVYVPETEYGRIQLGQKVEINVDSYPEKIYDGTVKYISDQAEFTPRNVQTVDGRRSTVFAVKISIPNPAHQLKSGMPADVKFIF